MEINAEKILLVAIQEGIASAVKVKLEGYNSPLQGTIEACIKKNEAAIHSLIDSAVSACVSDDEFKEEIRQSTRTQLARTLVQRIGGELEKQVNALKSNPTTRARITMAIDEIIRKNGQ